MKYKHYLDRSRYLCDVLQEYESEVTRIIAILENCRRHSNVVFCIGNGGSSFNAMHLSCDLFKMSHIKSLSLCDNIGLYSAIVNDNGWENVYVEQLKRLFNTYDVLVCFSVHGGEGEDHSGLWSQNILRAVDYVKKQKGKVIGFSGFDGGVMKEVCDICIVVPVDSTPLVESFHSVLSHYIAFKLQVGDRV